MRLFRILLLTFCAYVLISCGGAEERKAVYMEKAKTSIEAGDYDKARIELKNVLQIDPKDGGAYYQLGKVYEHKKEYRKAFGNYKKAAELSPDLLENHASLGRFYLLLNDKEKAREQLELILSKDADNPDGLLLSASTELKNKHEDKAIKIAEDILTRHPGHIDTVVFLAILHIKAKRFDTAINILDKAIQDEKNNETLNRLLASALMSNKDYARAETIFKDFLLRNPDSRASYNNLAAFYHQSGDRNKAEDTLRASVKNNESDVDRQTKLVAYLNATKGVDVAIKELRQLIEKNKGLGKLRTALAELLYAVKKDEQAAITVYKQAIEDFPEEVTGINSRIALATIYIKNYEYDSANEVIDDALEVSPNDPNVNFLKAKLAIKDNNLEQALISLRIVTKELPEKIEAYVLLANVYKSTDNEEQYNKTLNNAYENNRTNSDSLLKLARYQLSHDRHQAEKIIDYYNSLLENDYDGMSIKAEILNQKKQQDKAFPIAEKLMELYPDKPKGYIQTVPFYVQSGDMGSAISVLEKGYSNTNNNRDILLVLTRLQISQKHYDAAIDRLSAELQSSPDDQVLKLLLAKIYVVKNEPDRAVSLIKEVIDVDASLEGAYLLLSAIYRQDNDLSGSKSILIKGKNNVPSSIKIPLELATIYENENEFDNAVDVYRDAYEVHSDNMVIVNNLASMLSDYGNGKSDLDLAKTLALKMEKTKQPVFLDTIGWVYFKRGEYKKAVEFLTKAVYGAPDINVFNYHLGMAYKMSGDKEQAKSYLEKSLTGDKKFKQQDLAKKALDEL